MVVKPDCRVLADLMTEYGKNASIKNIPAKKVVQAFLPEIYIHYSNYNTFEIIKYLLDIKFLEKNTLQEISEKYCR